ncbi:MAG: hypothetical protein ACP5SI_03910 [Chloroflexia bacterium]
MTDFRTRAFEEREKSALKRLASRIPGYAGYYEKELRRDADRLLREYVAGRLEQQRRRLTEFQQEWLRTSGLALMGEMDEVTRKLQTLIDRLRSAVYGYAGWFDTLTVREEALDALYDYDATLLDEADALEVEIQAFGQAVQQQGDARSALTTLRERLVGLHEKVDRRRAILTGALPPAGEPPSTPAEEEVPQA